MLTFSRILVIWLSAISQVFAWEPSQEPATEISLTYQLFQPFGRTELLVSVDETGLISKFWLKTENQTVVLTPEELKNYTEPSLADIEIMHFGEFDPESTLGGNFSVCVPYGQLSEIEGENYWQRNTLVVYVNAEGYSVVNVPSIVEGVRWGEQNSCEIAAMEVYGF